MSAPLLATSAEMVTVTFDGVPVSVPKGTLLVEAAKLVKQQIPIYCYHTKLGPAGLCRICLVEIDGMPKLQIACNTTATDGMVVRTQGERVDAARAMVLELFLVNHPLDCPICDKGGECDLQDYSMAYARPNSDVADPKLPKPKAVELGPTIVLDEERCIVCQRCVRFDEIVAGERQLIVKDRGARDIIATATGRPYAHNFTGNVTELCPVGALTSKTYRFKSRPWDLARTQTTCTQCSVGCQLYADVRHDTLLRTMSVEDDTISDGWLCDRGRYNIGFYDAPERLVQPLYRKNGTLVQIGWDDACIIWAKAIREALAAQGSDSIGAIGGGRLTNEEAYLLQHVFRAAGVANLDWRAGTQRQAAPGAAGAPIEAIERAKAVVIVGLSPAERAPVLWLRIRKALRQGAMFVRAANAQEAREVVGDASPVALIWDGIDLELVRGYASAFAGVELQAYVASEQANARGAEAMGMLPGSGPGFTHAAKGLDGGAILDAARDGRLAVLSLHGVNPARNANDPAAAAQALERVPFLVVSELFATESTEHATLILPARGPFEKNGTTLGIGGELLPVNASLGAPEFVRSDLEILLALADELSVGVPDSGELHREVVRHVAATPGVVLGDARFAFERETRATVKERSILSGGGTWRHDARVAGMRA